MTVGAEFPYNHRTMDESTSVAALPYVLKDFAGIGGVIKQRPEDFFVQEVPLYEPAGEGEHVYAEIQKVGISTFDLVDRIARALNVPPRDIGYAGMKDAHAVTRQVISIPGATEEAVMGLASRIPGTQVMWASRHKNKLRLGHLKGNRFAVKVRNVDPTDVVRMRPAVKELEQRGMPNYFGEQRFGRRGNNDALGAALVRGDNAALLHLLLGDPKEDVDTNSQFKARQAFDARDNALSMKLWPRNSGMERRVLHRLMKTHRPGAAVRVVDEKLRRLWVSALQSRIFNEVTAERVNEGLLSSVIEGDLAYKHENGACFAVESADAERGRADAFEISATGPLVGYRVSLPTGKALDVEQAVFARHGLKPEDFRSSGRLRVKGARRPVRVRPTDVTVEGGVDENGNHVTVAFTLPAGSFATVLLRELMKNEGTAVDAEAAEETVVEEQGDEGGEEGREELAE